MKFKDLDSLISFLNENYNFSGRYKLFFDDVIILTDNKKYLSHSSGYKGSVVFNSKNVSVEAENLSVRISGFSFIELIETSVTVDLTFIIDNETEISLLGLRIWKN